MDGRDVDRRSFLKRAGAGVGGLTLLAGCTGSGGDGAGDGTPTSPPTETAGEATDTATGTPTGTATGSPTSGEPSGALNVATYSSFTGEGTAGNWLKSAFEERYPEVTVEFSTPENGINQFIQRKRQGAPIDADLYVGLNTGELVRVDETLDESLFAAARDRVAGTDSVKEGLRIDPQGRAIPYDTGYICIVYDEDEVESPATFDALLEPAYEGDLITQNAQQSDPGRAFLLWSIITQGEEEYLDYWSELANNGLRVLSDWEPAYNAYMNGEAAMVVSYSTDQVYYHGEGVDMSRHQIAFLNDQGYANPETMALFADSDRAELGRRFMEFVLTPEAQAEIAVRNVQFPAVEGVELPQEFSQYAYEPPEPVTFTYEELSGNVSTWIDRWARQIVSG
jgi:thiamine transport system substrate-binding protein